MRKTKRAVRPADWLAILFLGGAATAVAFFPREATPTNAAATAAPEQAAAGQPAAPAPATQAEQSEFERWYVQQPKADPGVPADGAAVVIVKFNDYQCPPCKQTYDNYNSVLAKYRASHPGAVRFVTSTFCRAASWRSSW